MRDGWLTQSGADVRRGMGCPSIERAIRLTTLDLIDTPGESFAACKQTHYAGLQTCSPAPGLPKAPLIFMRGLLRTLSKKSHPSAGASASQCIFYTLPELPHLPWQTTAQHAGLSPPRTRGPDVRLSRRS